MSRSALRTRVRAHAKTQVKAQLRTRTALVIETFREFLHLAREFQPGLLDATERDMELMIERQLFSSFIIAAFDGGSVVSVVRVSIDWNQHKALCAVRGEIDVGDVGADELLQSTSDVFSVARKYLRALSEANPKLKFKTYWSENPAELAKYGKRGLINRMLDCVPDMSLARRQLNANLMLLDALVNGRKIDRHIKKSMNKAATQMPEIAEITFDLLH